MAFQFSRRDVLRIGATGIALGAFPPFLRFSSKQGAALAGIGDGIFFTSEERATIDAALSRLIPDDIDPGAQGAKVIDYIDRFLGAFNVDPGGTPFLFAGGPFSDRNPHRDPDYCTDSPDALPIPPTCGGTYPNGTPCTNQMAEPIPVSRLRTLAWKVRIEGTTPDLTGEEINRIRANAALVGVVTEGDEIKGLQKTYRDGIAALDQFARDNFGGSYKELDPVRQELALDFFPEQDFVSLLFEHAVEGMYGLPEYGGNQPLQAGAEGAEGDPDHRPLGWRSIAYEGDRQPLGYTLFVPEAETGGCSTCHDRSPGSNVSPAAGEYCELPNHPVSGPEMGPDTTGLDREALGLSRGVLALLSTFHITLRGKRYRILAVP